MSIKVMLVSESHYTKFAFEAFLMGMGDHVPSKMRIPFECFTTVGLGADKGPLFRVFLTDVPKEMCIFVEGLTAL